MVHRSRAHSRAQQAVTITRKSTAAHGVAADRSVTMLWSADMRLTKRA
jgi:hypothetical protein